MDMRASDFSCDEHPVGSCASSASTGADEKSHLLANLTVTMNRHHFRVLAGIDLGRWQHHVCALHPSGEFWFERNFSHSIEGLTLALDWLLNLAEHRPEDIAVAIEKPHGAVVETLLARGVCVFSINPKQVDRFRDRHSVAGAKDDRRDAFVLADALRSDSHRFQRL